MFKFYTYWFWIFTIIWIELFLAEDPICIKNEICIISINGEICEYKLNCSNIGASSVSKVIRNRISEPGTLTLILFNTRFRSSVMRADHFPTTKAFLHHLRIENGNLGEIKPELFTEELFGQLKTFELINLPIKHLYLNSFSRLELLIIRNLTLTNIQLNNMPNLNYFSIFNCSQAILNIANLMMRAEVPKLKILLFNYNNINRTITANTFSGLRNIETLDLRYNRIESFSGNAFINLPSNVKTINLARNRLKFLPEKFFSILDRLKNNEVIHLYKNSFECGCQVENLRFYLSNFPKKFFEHSLTKRVFCKISEQNSITYMDVQHNPIICLELNKHETEEEVEEITDDDPPKIMNKITIYCHPRDSLIQPINLTINKPQHAISIVKHSSESKYCLKVNEYPMGYFIVGFENEFSIDEDQNLISTCILDSLHMKRKICSKPPLRPNHLYRFCVMKKNSATVSPLECVFSYTKTKVVTIGWISIKYRTIVVAAWIFVGVITFIFGTYLSFFLAKKHPKLFCRKVKKPIIIYRKTTSHFGRLNQRRNQLPDRNHSDNEEKNEKSTHDNPEYDDVDYIIWDNIAPPIPKRNRNVETRMCCDSDKCTCYMEVLD